MSGKFDNLKPGDVVTFAPGDGADGGHTEVVTEERAAVYNAGRVLSDGWKIERVKTDERSRREYVWQVTCPEKPPEATWDNDFQRGYRCGCRRFPSEGKATRYVEASRVKEHTP